jgi:hypothetical protein
MTEGGGRGEENYGRGSFDIRDSHRDRGGDGRGGDGRAGDGRGGDGRRADG